MATISGWWQTVQRCLFRLALRKKCVEQIRLGLLQLCSYQLSTLSLQKKDIFRILEEINQFWERAKHKIGNIRVTVSFKKKG